MLNLLIPMAGKGSRFANVGYARPKPFIEVNGRPMIELVINNLYRPGMNLILLVRKEHIDEHSAVISDLQQKYQASIVAVDLETEGTACTVLLARKHIDNDMPLLIANSDQLVDMDVEAYLGDAEARDLCGSILVFRDLERNPKWSFAQVNSDGRVLRVKEKEAISDLATVGIYLFARGEDFVSGAIDMICRRDLVGSEYYTCPVYNYLIAENMNIGVYEIDREAMHGLGTPQDLELYLSRQQ